jgi:nitrate reductase gamma subunit
MKCIVLNCENESHQGKFTGELCNPCHEFITTNKGKFSQAYRNTMRELTDEEILKTASNMFHYSEYKLVIQFARAILRKVSEK